MKPTIHAFNGRTGAGKSTVSKKFAKELGVFRISHDELLGIIYDREHLEREHASCCDRANRLAWKIIEQIASLGSDVVIEGWGSRKLRDQVRELAKEMNLEVKFYFVSCSQDERLNRVRKRNTQSNEDAPFITDEAFFRMESTGEDFEDDEPFTEISNQEHNKTCYLTAEAAPHP